MADNTIDTLSLQIESDAKSTYQSLDKLTKRLEKLGEVVGKMNFGDLGLKQFGQQSQKATKGMEDLAKTADKLRSKYAELGKNMTFSGSLKQLQGQLVKYQNLMNSAKLKEQSLFSAGKINTKGYDDAVRAATMYENVVVGLGEQIKALGSASANMKPLGDFTIEGLDGGAVKKLADFQKEIAQYRQIIAQGGYETESGRTMPYSSMLISLQQLREAFPLATAEMQEFESILQKAGINTNFGQVRQGVQEVEKGTADASEIIDRLQRKFAALGEGFTFRGNASELEGALSTATQKFDDLLAKEQEFISSGRSLNSPEFEGIQKGIAETSNQLEKLTAQKQSWDAFKNGLQNLSIPPINTDSLKRLESELSKEEARLEKFKAKLQNDISMGRVTTNTDDAGYRAQAEQIALTEKRIATIRDKIQNTDKAAGSAKGTERFATSMSKLGNVSKEVGRLLSKVAATFKKFAAGIGNAFAKLTGLKKGMQGVSSALGKENLSFNIGFKTLLKYGLGIRSLFVLFNRLRGAFSDAFGNLAQYSAELNASVSSMSSSLAQLKNSLATAFAPIVNVIAPYISQFVQMLSSAMNAVGRFFAVLTGKKFAAQAIKFPVNYAKSLGTAKNAADSAADAQKDLNEQLGLADYDELRVIDKQDKQDSGISGGGIGDIADGTEAGVQKMFDTVPAVNEWASKIRDAFLSGDWERLGTTIAQGLNKGLKKVYDAISWDNVGPKITKFTGAFTTAFNSLVRDFDWDLLGRTIGAGVNTAAYALNQLIGEDGIDFQQLGSKLSVGFRGLVDEIDWTNLGNLLGNGFMISWNLFTGFVDDMWRTSDLTGLTGWQEVGRALAEGAAGLFDKIDFGQIGTTLAGALNGISQTIQTFADDMTTNGTWQKIATSISTGLNNLISGFDPAAAGQAISSFVTGLLGTLLDVAETVEWEQFGQKIGQFLGEIDWGTILNQAFSILKETVGGIWEGLGGTSAGKFVQGVAVFKIGAEIMPFVNNISKALTGKTAVQQVAGGIGKLFSSALGEGGAFSGEVFSSLATTITPATAALGALAAGLGYTFATNEQVRQSFSDAVTAIQTGFQPVLQTMTDTIIPGLQSGWQGLVDLLTPFADFLQTAFVSIWQDMINPALSYIGTTVLPTLATTFENLWNNVLAPLGDFLNSVLSPAVETLSTWLTSLWQNVVEPLAAAVGDGLAKAFEGIAKVFNNTVIPAVGLVVDAVNGLWKNVLSPIGTFLTQTFAPVFDSVFNGIVDLIKDLQGAFGGLIDFITGVFSGDWGKAWDGIKTTFSNAVGGLGDILKMPVNAAIGFMNGLIDAVAWAVNGVASMLNHLNVDVPGWMTDITGITSIGFNLPTWNPSHIPYLEKGGLAFRKTLAVIGEGKDDEAVLPLNDNAYKRLAIGIVKNIPETNIGNIEINRSQAPYVTTANVPRSTYSDSFGDDVRKDMAAISSNTFNNNTNIAQAVKEALNGAAIYAEDHIVGYLQFKNQQARNQNGGLGILEV